MDRPWTKRNRLTRMGVIAALVAATSGSTLAQKARTDADDELAEYKPTHRLRFPGNPYIQSGAFSRDGRTLYVHVHGTAMNVWELLVHYWPEFLGAITATNSAVCLLALWRIMRRKRIVGEPHCRNCNYCLKGCESGRCPECGSPIRRPVLGRPMRRRTLPFALPLGLVLVGYTSLWVARVPRSGYASTWVNWWSYDLQPWAQRKGVSLTPWRRNVDRILEVDVLTGRTRRTLITRRNRLHAWCPLVVTPDGRGLLMTIDDGDRLGLFSIRSGRLRRALVCGDFQSKRTSRWQQIAGFDDEGRVAYAVLLDQPIRKTKLLAWNLRSGKSEVLFETDAEVLEKTGRTPMVTARRYYLVPGPGPLRLLELPASYRLGKRAVEVSVRDGVAPERVLANLSTSLWGYSEPAFSPDGNRVYLHVREFLTSLAEFDLHTGQRARSVHPPAGHHLFFRSCSDPHTGRLVASGVWHAPPIVTLLSLVTRGITHTQVFLIYDLNIGEWIGRYAQPDDGIYNDQWISPDGRFFAASGFLRDPKVGGRYQQELLIYDLRTLPHDLDPSHADQTQRSDD